jgi:hypothetical protein
VDAPTGTRRLLWLYVLVLVIYALLAGWWVCFFFNQGGLDRGPRAQRGAASCSRRR